MGSCLVSGSGAGGFLYPRTIEIRRTIGEAVINGVQEVGGIGYSGTQQTTVSSDPYREQVLFQNIPCSIQAEQSGRTKDGYLPSDATLKPLWLIIIPSQYLPQYSVRDRDLIYDDEGYRYIVDQNWFTALGYNLSAVRLEV